MVASPFGGSLRWIHSTATGASTCFKKKAQKNEQFRFPRQFGADRVLRPYEAQMAMAEYMFSIDSKFKGEQMAFYRKIYDETMFVFVMTKQGQLILYRKGKERVNDINIKEVTHFEFYEQDNTYSMNIITSKNKKLVITNFDRDPIDDVMQAIQAL